MKVKTNSHFTNGHEYLTVTGSSRTSSLAGRSSDLSGGTATSSSAWRLSYKDFWPRCTLADESFNNVKFEPFSVLLPRVNAWLRAHPLFDVTKCETIEKRISCVEQMHSDLLVIEEADDDNLNIYVIKGFRLWYMPRHSSDKPRSFAVQIGCRNVVPSRSDPIQFPLVFDNLTTTYSCLNDQWLMDCPLEGPILTVETVPFHILNVNVTFEVDETCWPVNAQHHILYVTRIFYEYSCPTYEQIGAADFMPDLRLCDTTMLKAAGDFGFMSKVDAWLSRIRDIRIVNIQTLCAAYEPNDNVNTSSNFIHAADIISSIHFVRVTYVRPKYGLPPGGLHTPYRLIQKCFTNNVCIADMTSLWQLAHQWIIENGKRVVSVETQLMPESVLNSPIMRSTQLYTTVIRLYVEETLSSDSNSCHNSSSTVARSQHVSSHVPQLEVFVVNKSSRESKHCILM